MLNRRLLRVKVMQALYAFFQSAGNDIGRAERELFLSIERVYDLYLHYLMLPAELLQVAEVQMEEARNKILPTEEDLNPNRKFIDNPVIHKLATNRHLLYAAEKSKVSWSKDQDLVKLIWKKIKESQLYREYMISADDSEALHRNFLMKIYSSLLLDSDLLYSHFQERSIYWEEEDSDFALHMAIRFIKKIKAKEENAEKLPPMYKDEEDRDFVKNLLRKTISHNKENDELVASKASNWEIERIAVLDVIIMKMAITEFLHLPTIPVKVTLNEYIEISKFFSSPKSKMFINGILDKLLISFKEESRIRKVGRGLMQ